MSKVLSHPPSHNTPGKDAIIFPKQAIPSSRAADPSALSLNKDHEHLPPKSPPTQHDQPVSLLTALLSSPGIKKPSPEPLSAKSSTPSTALSSPHIPPISTVSSSTKPEQLASILRRGSASSDGRDHVKLKTVNEGPKTSQQSDVEGFTSSHSVEPARSGSLKFAVAPSSTQTVKPQLVDLEPNLHLGALLDEEEASDLGYQEDSEDGFSDDEGMMWGPGHFDKDHRFSRSSRRHRSSSPLESPPTVLPPPKRGRGYVRVDPTLSAHQGCSRHYSPPPEGESSPRSGRLSEAGPRPGRAGSPMPSRKSISDDEEEDQDEDNVDQGQSPHQLVHGWRSDDAAIYGSRAQRRLVHSVFVDDSDEEDNDYNEYSKRFRGFLRRASEHISGFRRSSVSFVARSDEPGIVPAITPIGAACPPAFDDTPAMARSVSPANPFEQTPEGIAQRLEKSLISQSR